MSSTMDYLDKYGNINAVERILDIIESNVSFGNQNKYETALYYCYRGGLSLANNEVEAAVRFFKYGVLYAEPVSRENAELASNLYCNLGTSSMQIGDRKMSKKYIKQAVAIREKYQLPFNQNALTQELYLAQLIAADSRQKEAIKRISELIALIEALPYPMESSLGNYILCLGY